MKQILKLILIIISIACFPSIELVAGPNVKKEIKALKKEYALRQKEYNELKKYGVPDNVLQRKEVELAQLQELVELAQLQELIERLEGNGSTSKNDKTHQSAAIRYLVDAYSSPSKIAPIAFGNTSVETQAAVQQEIFPDPKKTNPNEEITLTVSSDGATKDDALKNALRTAIEQAYGVFVSANTTILNDELVKDEIVTVSNGSIKDYKELSSFEKPDGSGYMMTVNATVNLPHLITYAKNHGSECEFAGNTFGMELKLFNLQKENELKALYNAIPIIENLAKATMHWELQVDEPKIVDFQFKLKIEKSTEYKKGGGWNGKLPYRYEQAWGELITSDAYFDRNNPFYFETKIHKLLNKPVKRPDGLPSVEQDKEIIDILNEMQNGQCVLVRFRLSWLPNEGDNGLLNYIESLFKSLSIDYKTAERYKNQGYDLCMNMSGFDWGFGPDKYYHFRNSPKEIDIWTDSVMSVLNQVKNNFEIVDNTGQKSSFNPSELSEWIYLQQMDEMKSYKYLSPEQRAVLWDNRSKIEYQQYDPGIGRICTWGDHYITTYRLPNSNQKITTFQQYRHGSQPTNARNLITICGKGLFNNVACLNYYGDFHKPWDKFNNAWGKEATRTTWITYILIPLSEISKYSSFKVNSKDE